MSIPSIMTVETWQLNHPIREVTLADARELLEIYAPYILETPISFEIDRPPLQDFEARISKILGKYPYLVYETDGKILGYSYAGEFRERIAYSWSVESTVYVRQGYQGRGIGLRLYQALLDLLKKQGAVNVIGGITLPNEASVKLHERLGFTNIARIRDAGFKHGRWWDVGYWQLQFPKPNIPKPLLSPNLTFECRGEK